MQDHQRQSGLRRRVLLACGLFGCALAPLAIAQAPRSTLAERLGALVRTAAPQLGIAGIQVSDPATGESLFAFNADRLLMPGSNLKLFTGAMALERLGPDYRYTTRVLRESSGNVVLVGAGDPTFADHLYPYRYSKQPVARDPLLAVRALAEQLVRNGLRRIDGDIIGDDRWYPWEPYPGSWTQDDAQYDYGAPVSALSFNDNVIGVTVTPGAHAGDPVTVSQAFEFLTIQNLAVTGAKGSALQVSLKPVPNSREWILTGTLPEGHEPLSYLLPVDDPALYAASAFYEALLRAGVEIRGRPIARHRLAAQPFSEPEGEVLVARKSPPLGQILPRMNKLSVNLYAELFLRETAKAQHAEATMDGGLAELTNYARDVDAGTPFGATVDHHESDAKPLADFRAEDGSGLARNTMVTPALIARLLSRMANSPQKDLWIASLPVAGEDGTLNQRLCCMTEGRIQAKTGTLARALALSGYAESRNHGQLVFSILVNNFSAPAADVRQWIDKLAVALLE